MLCLVTVVCCVVLTVIACIGLGGGAYSLKVVTACCQSALHLYKVFSAPLLSLTNRCRT